ncbi:MAG: hypothetical protein RR446_07415 [Lachnospiraceae bacterium]
MAKIISLDRLCGGALLERFTMAMAQIGRNIMDPNTDPEKNRTVTIKLTFKPDKSRKGIKTSIATNVSLAPPVADETMLLIGQDLRSGRIEMSEYGDKSQAISMLGESIPVKAEVVPTAPGVSTYDPETGEIYDPANQRGPIDLRKAN